MLDSTRLSFKHHFSVPKDPLCEATRAAFPEMGNRVCDLNIRRDQTPDYPAVCYTKSHLFSGEKLALIVVKAVPSSSKPPLEDDSMHASTNGRYGLAIECFR